MKNIEQDDFSTQTAFTNAYSSPSTGSLESIMGNTNSENSSPTPPPSHDERNVSRYMDNLRYAWCFNNKAEMPANNRSHKISPSLDVFCTDRLCSRRRTKTPENRSKDDEEVCCGLGALTIASLTLIGTAEFFILITAAYAAYYCFSHSGNWDIGGVIFGLTFAHTFFAAIFAYGIFKKCFKFLLPLTFLSFLIVVSGCAAFLVAFFTSFGGEKFSDSELVAHITFCFLLGVIICHQLAFFIVSIKIFFIMRNI